ncbi:MAG: hypothetical protein ACI8QD_002036 [Cyclobacteriaceae bacterium]|jgi:hypothetical protein
MQLKHRKPPKAKTGGTPEWLKTIQVNSWEAELLISALLLFALFQVPEALTVIFRKEIPPGSLLLGFGDRLVSGFKLLRLGYTLHIIVRGIWVASVGLSFVFPQGVRKENTGFRAGFSKELETDGNLEGFVMKLEQLSSMIYGLSFMLFGLLLGGFSYLFIFVLISVYGMSDAMANGQVGLMLVSTVFVLIYAFIGLIMLVDFVTNGFFRREKSIAKYFYPIAKIFRVISFSILYRRSLLVLQTNLNGWKRALLPFILIFSVWLYWYANGNYLDRQQEVYYEFVDSRLNTYYYESLRGFDDYLMVSIPSPLVNENAVKVFVKDINMFRRLYAFEADFEMGDDYNELSDAEKLKYVKKYLQFTLNNTPLLDPLVYTQKHPVNQRFGFTGYIDLSDFSRGNKLLEVRFDSTSLSADQKRFIKTEGEVLAKTPFFFDKP